MSEYRKTSLSPMLSVRRGVQAVEFYKEALGAVVVQKIENDGSIVAHLNIHGSPFWVADESPANKNFSPETLGGSTVRLVLTVQDPDSVFARAVAAGATAVCPVRDEHYGWRVGRIADPFGHQWEIGKPLE
jgi:PhnB protein